MNISIKKLWKYMTNYPKQTWLKILRHTRLTFAFHIIFVNIIVVGLQCVQRALSCSSLHELQTCDEENSYSPSS